MGCTTTKSSVDKALELRQKLINAQGCTFDVSITADYVESIYTFEMQCSVDQSNNLNFTVTQPDTISGISGLINLDQSHFTFDDKMLIFSTISDGQISPVSAPWVFINALKNGYIRASSQTSGGYTVYVDDSYKENALELEILIDVNDSPVSADIHWQGRRILALRISNFVIL